MATSSQDNFISFFQLVLHYLLYDLHTMNVIGICSLQHITISLYVKLSPCCIKFVGANLCNVSLPSSCERA